MKTIRKSGRMNRTTGLSILIATLLLNVWADAQSTNFLTGYGTAAIDGRLSPGEWDKAGVLPLEVNLPEGGTTSGSIFVMNDRTNLYLGIRFLRSSADPGNTAEFEFDKDGSGDLSHGDDIILLNPDLGFFDGVRTTNPPCPPSYLCGVSDTDVGGQIDGAARFSNDGTTTVYEFSHPLSSPDTAHDFSLAPGQVIGCWPSIRLLNATNYADTDAAAVAILIASPPPNHPPIAIPQSLLGAENATVEILLAGSDPDHDSLTYSIINGPIHGVLTGLPPLLIYQPNSNYFGLDEFTFKVNDGQADSQQASVSIAIVRFDRAPIARIQISPRVILPGSSVLGVIAMDRVQARVVLDGSLSSDPDGDALQYTWREIENIASGVVATHSFGLGRHTVGLLVSDGPETGEESVSFDVVTPAGAVGWLTAMVESSSLPANRKAPLFASLKAAEASFTRGNFVSGVAQLQAFRAKVLAQTPRFDRAFGLQLRRVSQQIIDVMAAEETSQTSGAVAAMKPKY